MPLLVKKGKYMNKIKHTLFFNNKKIKQPLTQPNFLQVRPPKNTVLKDSNFIKDMTPIVTTALGALRVKALSTTNIISPAICGS